MIEWKPVKDYEGYYEVSNDGRIKSIRSGKLLSTKKRLKGYAGVNLSVGGKAKTLTVHRIVARAFLGDQPDMTVNHINGDKLDNRADNLEWLTAHENATHAAKIGLYRTGERHHNHKLSDIQRATARVMYRYGAKIHEIAKEFSMSWEGMRDVVNARY